MRHTIALLATTLLLAGAAVGCSKSYDDTVNDCTKALAAQFEEDGKGKPDACKDVKEDDYSAILMNQIMGDQGWLDEDGRFDKGKFYEDAFDGEQ
jgi:hypothetical protein